MQKEHEKNRAPSVAKEEQEAFTKFKSLAADREQHKGAFLWSDNLRQSSLSDR